MTTPELAATGPDDDTPRLALDEGPLQDALAGIDAARRGIAEAEEALVVRRGELAVALRDQLEAVVDADPDDVVEEVGPTLATLYWDHAEVIRVKDLTDATGLSGAQLRKVVGPRLLEVDCSGCGTTIQVVRRSRSQPLPRECGACRWRPPAPSPWTIDPASDPLHRLVEHLDAVVARSGCDGSLTRTRAWAAAVGLDPGAVVAEVTSLGGHCDCEVVLNVPVSGHRRARRFDRF